MTGRRILLHCGGNKTGTTAVQSACDAGRAVLAQHEVHYPDLRLGPLAVRSHVPLVLAFLDDPAAHYLTKDAGLGTAEARALGEAAWTRLEQDWAASDCPAMLISTEAIARLPVAGLAALKARLMRLCDRLDVVYFGREPVGGSLSLLQQQVTGGQMLSLPQSWLRRVSRHGQAAARLAEVFGPALQLGLHDRARLQGGDMLAEILCARLGLPAIPAGLTQCEANASLGAPMVALLHALNRVVPRRQDNRLNPLFKLARDHARRQSCGKGPQDRLRYPSPVWLAAVRHGTAADWGHFLDLAGLQAEAAQWRALVAADPPPPPPRGQFWAVAFDRWMLDYLTQVNETDLPEPLRVPYRTALHSLRNSARAGTPQGAAMQETE